MQVIKKNKIKQLKKQNNYVKINKVKKPKLKSQSHLGLKIILTIIIILFGSFLAFCMYIAFNAPSFDSSLLYKKQSTIILNNKNQEIARLGSENRELVSYNDLPQVLVDAIVATEDSRFFEHNGFDVARFMKAVTGHLEGNDAAGGASTLTMQLSKNAFTSTETDGVKGIIRKFTDIYMAVFKIEKEYSKEDIIEIYANYPYLGGGSYGVEMASKTYFGKDVNELSLPEAALIAGLFNAPDDNDPYKHLDNAENRRNEVLNLMYKHGYITKEELEDAESISVASLLSQNNTLSNTYQDFIDTLVADIISDTGLNPYATSMVIYSTLDTSVQTAVNSAMNNPNNFKDKVIQAGIAITSSDSGAVLGIGAGRNKSGVRQYNFATMIKRHPGSAIKPFMDYGPLFEYNGATPNTVLYDTPYTYSNGTIINDADRHYMGAMTIKEALAQSRNIPALKAFQQVDKTKIANYVHSFGINYGDTLYESCAIGGFNGVSPLQMSAAYGAYARGGIYIAPYTYTKIIYRDSNEEYNKNIKKTRVCSEQTAKYINDILTYAINKGILCTLDIGSTVVAGKTGTSTVGIDAINQYHLDDSAIMDSWACLYSKEYSVAIWYGYDTISNTYYMKPIDGTLGRRRIAKKLAKELFQTGSKLVTSD
jgi:penicillin-binding protein 1A